MNNLPLISHHLYVASLANESRVRSNITPRDPARRSLVESARTIPLEFMGRDENRPAAMARPLRRIRVGGGI